MTFSSALSTDFKGVVSKFVSAAKALKSDILKAAEKAPVVVTDIEKDAPELASLLELVFPGAGAVEAAGLAALEKIVEAVEAAGSSATANGLNISFDKELIASVEAILPALKAFAAKL